MRNTTWDLLIHGGRVVTPDGVQRLEVGVADGRVAGLFEPGSLSNATERIDATGCYVLPGAIDTHTHAFWPLGPDRRSADTFAAAGRAAAVGGTTTMIDFVPRLGDESLRAAADRRMGEITGSPVDIALHPILDRADAAAIAEIPALIEAGLSSFKIYTTYDNRLEHGEVVRAMKTIHEHGGIAGFHAEDHDVLSQSLRETGSDRALPRFAASRPDWAESAAIARICQRAAELDATVYFYHLSGKTALAAVDAARWQGVRAHAETCTHYLARTDDVYREPDGWKYTITPPLRPGSSRIELWKAVADGRIDAIGSDHCAYLREEKTAAVTDFSAVPYGAPGIEARIPLLWSQGVAAGRITIEEFVGVTAERPARLFGLYPRKGVIRVGADADLVVLDPHASWTWPALPGSEGTDYTLYDGEQGTGLPIVTIAHGVVVARHGHATGAAPGGYLPQRIGDRHA